MADDKKQNPTTEGRKPDTPAPNTLGGPPAQKQATIPSMDGRTSRDGSFVLYYTVKTAPTFSELEK